MAGNRTNCALALLFALPVASGCSGETIGQDEQGLAIDGRWRIPADILAQGDTQTVEYTGAGPWMADESSCQGGMTMGAEVLREYLYEHFPQGYTIGGYNCRPINGDPSQTSVHATGRALDIMIETMPGGSADNDLGDPLAHWLIQNAEDIGIQFIIWDQTTWAPYRDPGERERAYGGAHPHNDHLHIELSVEGGNMETNWFAREWEAPILPNCDPLPPEGGIIDNIEGCTQLLGPSEYWRYEDGPGYGGGLAWTNATQKDTASNWARFQLAFMEAGEYEVEFYSEPGFAQFNRTRYEILHRGERSSVVANQDQGEGWHSLGTFQFDAGYGQAIELFDNTETAVDGEQHISADAVRITRIGGPAGPGDGGGDEEGGFGGTVLGGCSASGSPGSGSSGSGSGAGSWMLALAGLLFWRRRRAAPSS